MYRTSLLKCTKNNFIGTQQRDNTENRAIRCLKCIFIVSHIITEIIVIYFQIKQNEIFEIYDNRVLNLAQVCFCELIVQKKCE